MYAFIGSACVSNRCGDVIVLNSPRLRGDFDLCANPITITPGTFQLDKKPVICPFGGIVENPRWFADHGDNRIDSAVIVQIAQGATSMRGGYPQCGSRVPAPIFEATIAQVPKQSIRLAIAVSAIEIDIFADVGVRRK